MNPALGSHSGALPGKCAHAGKVPKYKIFPQWILRHRKVRSIVYNRGIRKSRPKLHRRRSPQESINQPVSTPRHGEGPGAKTWGASTPANSAAPFDRRRPPKGVGGHKVYAKFRARSLRCARRRRVRPRPVMCHFDVLVHVGNGNSQGARNN